MSRLKIVDQNGFSVPFHFSQLGISLAYNGEIYNWQELRHELSARLNLSWETRCDAEVLAAAWRDMGPACLNSFNGMWGFILVDHVTNEIFLVRDRAGEKPLYYTQRNNVLYASSEIKALPVPLEAGPCADVGMLEYDFRRRTPLKDVFALEPGCYVRLTRSAQLHLDVTQQTWWRLPVVSESRVPLSYPEAKEELQALIVDAVKLRANPEVPYAVQLSGGLDSSIIQAVAKSERMYCVSFPEAGFQHINMAQQARGGSASDITAVSFTAADMWHDMPHIVYHLDTPATWTAVCQWRMFKQMQKDGVKVTLSGEGVDELFGGYSRYRILYWLQAMRDDGLLTSYAPLIEHMTGTVPNVLARMLDRGQDAETRLHALNTIVGLRGPHDNLVKAMMYVDFYTTMQVLLRMADRMSAAYGIENRTPLLDYRIMEFAARLPASYMVTKSRSKSIIRDIAQDLGVPEAIVNEKTKRGLAIPWPVWSQQVPLEHVGTRGVWDRAAFSNEMNKVWKATCCREALCASCPK